MVCVCISLPNNNYTYSQIIGSINVTVSRLRIKLCADVNFVYSTVDAITHWDINQSITSPNWRLKDQVKLTIQNNMKVLKNHSDLDSVLFKTKN